MNKDFKQELSDLINAHSLERPSDTADYVLADYLCACLRAYNEAIAYRDSESKYKIALADAIRRPMGVVPDSAQGLLSQVDLDEAETRRATETVVQKEMGDVGF